MFINIKLSTCLQIDQQYFFTIINNVFMFDTLTHYIQCLITFNTPNSK